MVELPAEGWLEGGTTEAGPAASEPREPADGAEGPGADEADGPDGADGPADKALSPREVICTAASKLSAAKFCANVGWGYWILVSFD